ncbi:MAG TPA: hypothetical protein VFI25_05980 [Planctomycetota bacterium]|nr:hypothetical protein [Planctomycetota bacterium]
MNERVARNRTPETPLGEDLARFLVLHDPLTDRTIHLEPVVGSKSLEDAVRALLAALAGDGPMGPYPGRPAEIWTNSTALEECAREALAGLGIRLVRSESVPEFERLREFLDVFMEGRGPSTRGPSFED